MTFKLVLVNSINYIARLFNFNSINVRYRENRVCGSGPKGDLYRNIALSLQQFHFYIEYNNNNNNNRNSKFNR